MQTAAPNHYATLGLHQRCTLQQIRSAYRLLAKQHHPDHNPGSAAALRHIQAINAAYEILSDPDRRAAYDSELAAPEKISSAPRPAKIQRNLAQDVRLPLEDFLRGTTRAVHVNDPANPAGRELYELVVPPGTAPGTRFRLPRQGIFAGGTVQLRVQPQPHFRFRARGADLRCDLKIKPERAAQGGTEMVRSLTGGMVRVTIPRGAGRHEILRVPGEGLPKARGGRGDLLVRLDYRVAVRITRSGK